MKYDVFGLGNALMDVQVFVDDDFLKAHNIQKGIMTLVEEERSQEIISAIANQRSSSIPGGSCGNTISAVAVLGGKGCYTYVVADDMYGRLYETKISGRGVKSFARLKETGLTGTSIVLTTGDAERTMLTHLGVCREFTKDDVDFEVLSHSKVFHCTGYELDTPLQKEALKESMKRAKKMGVKISFDIADPFCIERNVVELKELISEYVDILFGNKDEVAILTGISDPVEAGKAIVAMGPEIVLAKVGSKGSYVFHDGKYDIVPVYQASQVLDSTGCGDIYAGGFLYGFTQGYDPVKSAHIASYCAAQIITVAGVQLEKLDFGKIKSFIHDTIIG